MIMKVLTGIRKKQKRVLMVVGMVTIMVGGAVGLYYRVAGRPSKKGAGAEGELEGEGGIRAESRSDVALMLEHLHETVIKKVDDFFYPAKAMVETTARTLNKYTSIRKDPYYERYVYDVITKYRQFDNFYIADATGSRVMASNRGRDQIKTDVIDRSGDEPFRILKQWDSTGKVISTERHTEKQLVANPALGGLNEAKSGIWDARKRPWYRKVAKEKATCWSDVYIFSASREPGITAASPALGAQGEPVFVVAADFEIRNISHFLAELDVGGDGLVFIINGKGELIAYPEAEKVLTLEDGKPVLAKAQAVVPDWAKAALDAHRDEGNDLFVFSHDGVSYIASFAPFLEQFGNDWRLVVVAPEEELLSRGVKARG